MAQPPSGFSPPLRPPPDPMPAVKAAINAAAGRLLAEARARAPVDTGELRDSARIVTGPDGSVGVAFTAPHARPVEARTQYLAEGAERVLRDAGPDLRAAVAARLKG